MVAAALGVAAALAVSVLSPTAASAHAGVLPQVGALQDDNCYGDFSWDGGAFACFVPYGEHLWLCDTAADGHHPAVRYRINGGSWTIKHADLSNGNCIDYNLDIAETGYIEFEPRNYEGSTIISYGPISPRISANG